MLKYSPSIYYAKMIDYNTYFDTTKKYLKVD